MKSQISFLIVLAATVAFAEPPEAIQCFSLHLEHVSHGAFKPFQEAFQSCERNILLAHFHAMQRR